MTGVKGLSPHELAHKTNKKTDYVVASYKSK